MADSSEWWRWQTWLSPGMTDDEIVKWGRRALEASARWNREMRDPRYPHRAALVALVPIAIWDKQHPLPDDLEHMAPGDDWGDVAQDGVAR